MSAQVFNVKTNAFLIITLDSTSQQAAAGDGCYWADLVHRSGLGAAFATWALNNF